MFITFEGPDGSGKSTQVDFAEKYLLSKGLDVIKTRDPGGTELGLQLREILLNYKGDICPLTEMFIFLADRAQHVEHKILPLKKQGKIILCDRFIDSTIAYQGYARGLSIEAIEFMNKIATQSLMPDKTFLFDISLETTMTRVAQSGNKDRLESEMKEFHQKVIDGYKNLAQKDHERFIIIDSNRTIKEINESVKKALDEILLIENILT